MDAYGRKSLSELRTDVRRNLNAVQALVFDATTGKEGAGTAFVYDELFPEPHVDMYLNEALTARYLDLVINAETEFADETTIDVTEDIVEYTLPDEMAILRGLWWKDPNTAASLVPPADRLYMHMKDEGDDPIDAVYNGAPTYRRQMHHIVLNTTPTEDNLTGILVRYIKWINPLTADTQVIESSFARVLQEVVILDATIAAGERRAKMDMSTLLATLQKWEVRLAALARSSTTPAFMNLTTRLPFSGVRTW